MNIKNILLGLIVISMMIFLISFGESGFNLNNQIIMQLRLPKVLVCLLAGGMLSIAGLLMQIFFQNPLAGPDILGISSGSSLFVAFWMMAAATFSPAILNWGMNLMSFLGALSVFLVLIFFVHKNMSRVSLIIVGILISSFTSSGISILVNISEVVQLKSYLLWSMGSFRNVTSDDLPRFVFLSIFSLVPVFLFLKPLNQFLLSENYAKSMGVDVKKMKFIFIILAALLVSIVTLYCGPIGFIGIISPHLAKKIIKKSDLKDIIGASFLIGSFLALFAEMIQVIAPPSLVSINAILGLIGAPVIISYLYRQKEWTL